MNIIKQFQSLNSQNKRYVSFGLLIALLVALPVSIWAITTGTYDIRNRAQEVGEPNSCGGTCGSNYNCANELFCYEGYCRNPFCKDDTDCVCSTSTPTATATATAKATIKPTPTALASATASATPTATASATPTVTATPSAIPTEIPTPEKTTGFPYTYVIGGLLIILLVVIFLMLKKKSGPKPPTPNIPETPTQAPPEIANQQSSGPSQETLSQYGNAPVTSQEVQRPLETQDSPMPTPPTDQNRY